ncbi:hypothetical protein ACL02U_25035 [Streptomyces sp. MS06]|uniref:hypothetical protein n=1 Tax=Streptomyces sp. MS06 TaxID=3385974 RepID=UPI0039A000C1
MVRSSLRRRPGVLALLAMIVAAPFAMAAAPPEASASGASKGSPTAVTDHGSPHSDTSRQVARFKRRLAESGYVSQSGTEGVFDLNGRYCDGTVFSGMWPNPQSPYILTGLPEVPGQAPNTNPPRSWRLRQDEAVVMIGTTPPPEEYFGVDLTRIKGSLHTGPVVWTSVVDPVNNKTVRTNGRTPYSKPFALVITGNRRTRDEVDRMLAASGLGRGTNNMTIPPAMYRLGLGKRSDEFLIGIRTIVAKPGFEKALDDYRAAPPIEVFRVRPQGHSQNQTKPVYRPNPLPVPRMRVSGTGATELDLNPTLQHLRQRIIAAHPGYKARDIVVRRGFEESNPGLQENLVTDPPITGVAALSNDADDPITRNFRLPDGSFAVAYGTNHVATRQASYSSIAMYAGPRAAVSLTAENNRELEGTARDFLGDRPNADKFYAWTFSRAGNAGPTGPHVTELPSAKTNFCSQYGTDRPVDMTRIRAVARAYMQPQTLTRPALSSLLLDRLLVFTPR